MDARIKSGHDRSEDRSRKKETGRRIMRNETLTYQVDGLTMKSQLFYEPSTQPRAGVLVWPEAFGLGPHAISRAERLAGLGYVALACDVFGDATLLTDLNQAIGLLTPLYANTALMRARGKAAYAALAARPEVDATRIALWRHRPQLHQHGSGQAQQPGGDALLGRSRCQLLGGDAAAVFRDAEIAAGERWRVASPIASIRCR
jgi:hypothetical protein